MKRANYHTRGMTAFCVKDYGQSWTDAGTEEQRTEAQERMQAEWWRAADALAKTHGFDGCYSVGRSCGWAQPSPQSEDDEDLPARLDAFEVELAALLADTPARFADELAFIMESDAEQAADQARADAKARALREAYEWARDACKEITIQHRAACASPNALPFRDFAQVANCIAQAALDKFAAVERMP